MASPIQVILNPENYEEAREGGGGGARKDFFAQRDDAFRAHKQALAEQLEGAARVLDAQPQGALGVIKVVLRRSAWAKTHRPVIKLFTPRRARLVGGGDLGELYYEVRPQALRAISDTIAEAENGTQLKPDRDSRKPRPNPSIARSETGAIDKIELYGQRDRRRFSVDEAIAWLTNPMTGGAYEVELFEMPPPRGQWDAADPARQRLYASFVDGLSALGPGLMVQRLPVGMRDQPLLAFRLDQSTAASIVQLLQPAAGDRLADGRALAPFDSRPERHHRLLAFLDSHPLVRQIALPPVVTRTIVAEPRLRGSVAAPGGTAGMAVMPRRNTVRAYPRIGIIDGGIGAALDDWVIDRWGTLAASDMDEAHGTFIGGLAVAGSSLNGSDVFAEPDGAELVDIAVFPNDKNPDAFKNYFPYGMSQFFDEVEYAVADAKARHKVRVFNLSLNVQHQATPDRYSPYAARLDAIAETHDVLFILAAGNTDVPNLRPEWPADPTQALIALASARNDGLLMPAESVRNIAVAALNPPNLPNVIGFAPARYSRRGPGLRAGVKPDLAHVGGSGSPQPPHGHGLISVTPAGALVDSCGTSYASPLVAKTTAVLEQSIEGDVSRETLTALMMHHARLPDLLAVRPLSSVARDLVGFGQPLMARNVLEGADNQITLVFAARIRADQEIAFRFTWPPSLVGPDGSCRGFAKLTLVSTPPLDPRFGSEFVRINIDGALQQEHLDKDGKLHWKGQLEPIYLPSKADAGALEAERIENFLKWSSVKMFARTMPRGVGKSSTWRLFVEYLTRANEAMPSNGVPFTAVLTIADPDGKAPVFNDMRKSLTALGARIEDIRTAARVATRI